MDRHIVVSSNCQTGGIAACLRAIFPADRISPVPVSRRPFPDAGAEQEFVEQLRQADVWVSLAHHDLVEKYALKNCTPGLQLVKIPRIVFGAFHPDLCYAKSVSTGGFSVPHYNSAIGVWAYRNGLDIADAEALFNAEVYEELGFFARWNASVGFLQGEFAGCGLDFARFFLAVKREGQFMHSTNHPKIHVLARLAKLVSLQLGESAPILDRAFDVGDALGDIAWPMYPEIGDRLSLPSSGYEWRMDDGTRLSSVRQYLEYAFENYARQKIGRDDLRPVRVDEALYDRVLGARTKAGK